MWRPEKQEPVLDHIVIILRKYKSVQTRLRIALKDDTHDVHATCDEHAQPLHHAFQQSIADVINYDKQKINP